MVCCKGQNQEPAVGKTLRLSLIYTQMSCAWSADGVGKGLCLSIACTQMTCAWSADGVLQNCSTKVKTKSLLWGTTVLERNTYTVDLCLECRWCAAGVQRQQTCPLLQMLWPPATSRALLASSKGRALAPTATWPGLPR